MVVQSMAVSVVGDSMPCVCVHVCVHVRQVCVCVCGLVN